MHIYTFTYPHACVRVYTHKHPGILYIHIYTYTHFHMHTCLYRCMCTYTHAQCVLITLHRWVIGRQIREHTAYTSCNLLQYLFRNLSLCSELFSGY